MKRIFALMICLALAACMLTACGDDDIYREPGNGTTLGGGTVTTPAPSDDNGSYSADPDGDVSQTTDNDGVLEDGIDDIGEGIDQGMNDIGQGLEDIGDDIGDAVDGDDAGRGTNASDNMNDANGVNGSDAMGGDAAMNGENGSGNESGNPANGTPGTNSGATNGNSH